MTEPIETKGFGKPANSTQPSTTKKKRRQPRLPDEEFKAMKRYEEAEKSGKPSFEIFVRPVGETEWKPAGAIAVPSNMVNNAIFDSEEKLKVSATRQHASLRKSKEPLEFGYRRKEFEDDPVTLAVRPKPTMLGKFRKFLTEKFPQEKNAAKKK
jgi:hypothetical protein